MQQKEEKTMSNHTSTIHVHSHGVKFVFISHTGSVRVLAPSSSKPSS